MLTQIVRLVGPEHRRQQADAEKVSADGIGHDVESVVRGCDVVALFEADDESQRSILASLELDE